MDQATLITAFTTLFVIIDPIGLAPIFLALTQGMSAKQRRAIAFKATAIGGIALLAFAVFGEALLSGIGITIPAFRIAGGVLLFITALDMLFERRQSRREDQSDAAHERSDEDIAVFPLAIPLIAGPGAITTVILLTGASTSTADFMAILGITAAVLAIAMLLFLAANPIERILGPTGIIVISRVFGMLLAALAVQFILDGLAGAGVIATVSGGH